MTHFLVRTAFPSAPSLPSAPLLSDGIKKKKQILFWWHCRSDSNLHSIKGPFSFICSANKQTNAEGANERESRIGRGKRRKKNIESKHISNLFGSKTRSFSLLHLFQFILPTSRRRLWARLFPIAGRSAGWAEVSAFYCHSRYVVRPVRHQLITNDRTVGGTQAAASFGGRKARRSFKKNF